MDGAGGCHVDTGQLYFQLLSVANSQISKLGKIDHPKLNIILNYLLIQQVDLGNPFNFFTCKKRVGALRSTTTTLSKLKSGTRY